MAIRRKQILNSTAKAHGPCRAANLNSGNHFEDGARREVKEETGMELRIGQDVICVNNDKVPDAHFVTIGLFAEDFAGEPKRDGAGRDRGMEMVHAGRSTAAHFIFPSAKVINNYRKRSVLYIATIKIITIHEQSQKHILKYEEVGIKDVPQVGGKNASLGEMIVTLEIERRAGAVGIRRDGVGLFLFFTKHEA